MSGVWERLVEWMPIESIRPLESSQYRDLVDAYAAAFTAGVWDLRRVPPIVIYVRSVPAWSVPSYQGSEKFVDRIDLYNGHHRFLAAKRAGVTTVPTINIDAMRPSDKRSLRASVNAFRRRYAPRNAQFGGLAAFVRR